MQKIIKWILAVLCAAAICVALITLGATDQRSLDTSEKTLDASKENPQPAAQQYAYIANQSVYFYDVDVDYNWAFQAIDYLATLNVVRGTDKYLFQPEESITRADFVLMLYRAYDMTSYASGQYFADVIPNAYYADAVLATRNLGISKGEEGKFYPKRSVTRQDAMVLLERTLEAAGVRLPEGNLSMYSDEENVKFYARDALGKLTQAGIIRGSDGKINPASAVSRAEMAVMLYRALMVENDENGMPHYKAHPERVNLCIGEKIYSGATVVNYDPTKTYAGLMAYTTFEQTENGHMITLGDICQMDQRIIYANGVLLVDGKEMKIAEDCVGVREIP